MNDDQPSYVGGYHKVVRQVLDVDQLIIKESLINIHQGLLDDKLIYILYLKSLNSTQSTQREPSLDKQPQIERHYCIYIVSGESSFQVIMNQSLLTLGMEKEAGTVDCCCLSVDVASLHEQILPLSNIVAWVAANKNQTKGSRGQAGNQLKLAIAHGIWNSAFRE